MKRYWKILLALAIIFVAGGGFGYNVGSGVRDERQKPLIHPEGWAGAMMDRLERVLDLSDEQRDQVQPKLRDTATQLYQIRRRTTREQALTIRDFYIELDPILTEEQRQQLLESREKVRERIEQLQSREDGAHPLLRPLRPPLAE